MMLWVNLIMDTLGALALGTEQPKLEVLNRRPYKREANLVSRPMMRNILCQSAFQLTLLIIVLFGGESMFGVPEGEYCAKYKQKKNPNAQWHHSSALRNPTSPPPDLSCDTIWATLKSQCDDVDEDCMRAEQMNLAAGSFWDLQDFESQCVDGCREYSYVHGSLIFNTFVFCQVFNEYNSKSIHSDWNIFSGMAENHIFLGVTALTVFLQFILIEFAGVFIKTSPLTFMQWIITILLGLISFPVGILMRFIPVEEDEATFFGSGLAAAPNPEKGAESKNMEVEKY